MAEDPKTSKEPRLSRFERRVELFSKKNGARERKNGKQVTSAKHRSAITNGAKILISGDHRSAWLRRFRDIIAEHVADLGGQDNISSAEMALVRAAAQLRLQHESMEDHWAKRYDGIAPTSRLQDYQKTVGALRRVLESLGLKRRARDVTPDLRTYLAQKAQEANGASAQDE